MTQARTVRDSTLWVWAGVFFMAAAVALQCRFAFIYRPLSWRLLGDSDYQHLLPLELRSIDPGLYRKDKLLLNVEHDYPRVWVKAAASLAKLSSGDLMVANQILGLTTLVVAAAGMFTLALESTGSIFAAGVSVFLLLAGGLDPHRCFFLRLGIFAIPREQALALYPWMLLACLRRARGKGGLPWEALLIATSMNIHTPMTVYAVLGIGFAWTFVPQARPRLDPACITVLALSGLAASVSLVPFVQSFGTAQHAGRDFFLRFYSHYWPISNRPGLVIKTVATAYWWGIASVRLVALWWVSRVWFLWKKDPGARAAAIAAAAGSLLYAAYLVLPAVAFNSSLFLAGYRAFLPAAIPLLPLAANVWRGWEGTGRARWLAAAVCAALLAVSARGAFGGQSVVPAFAQAEEDLASAARESTPQDSIVLIPTEWAEFRFLSRRASFGDHRMLVMVWAWYRASGEQAGRQWDALDAAYRNADQEGLRRVATAEGAEYAVVPLEWNFPSEDTLRTSGDFKLVRLSGGLGHK